MKRLSTSLILFLILIGNAIAESESWLSIGVEYGNFFEKTSSSGVTLDSYIGSPGMSLSDYTFWNKDNIGLFVHDSFLLPKDMTATINGATSNIDLSIYDLMIQTGLLIGPGVRYIICPNIAMHFGFGPNIIETSASYSKYNSYYNQTISYSMLSFDIGAGIDAGFKVDFGSVLYLDIGTLVIFDMINYTSISSSFGNASAWSDGNYSLISVQPYLCLGFNIYNSTVGFGKPK